MALPALLFAFNALAVELHPVPAPPIIGAKSYFMIDGKTGHELASLKPRIVVTESRHPKSLAGLELADELSERKIEVDAITASTHEALETARKLAINGDLILATGSLFVAAEIIEIEHGIVPELYPDIRLPASPATPDR